MEDWLRGRLPDNLVEDEILVRYILDVLKDDDNPREQLADLLESAADNVTSVNAVTRDRSVGRADWRGV